MLADWRVLPAILISFSLILIVFAIVGPIIIENKINDKLASQFLFTEPSGKGFDRWVNNTQPDSAVVYLYVYVYNVTNPNETAFGLEKAHIEEIGPYVYRQFLQNVNMTFEDYNEERVVTATPWTYMKFDRELTPANLKEDDRITAPHIGFWTVIHSQILIENPDFKDIILSICADNGWGAFITANVSEWLFGFNDPFLELLQELLGESFIPTTYVQYIRNQTNPQDAWNQVKSSTVSCGFPNTKRFQQIIKFQTNAAVPFWAPPLNVTGSPGNFFGFYRRGHGVAENVFWPQIARNLPLEFETDNVYKGVDVYRYIFPETVVQNKSEYPPNAQFFQDGPKGLFNASAILFPAQIFYSWPHFYQGDPILRTYFTGMSEPNETDRSFIELQPIIGANCHSVRKSQGNLRFGDLVDPVNTGVNISEVFFFPTYWMNLENDLSDQSADEMRSSLAFYDTAKVGSKAILFTCSFLSPILFGIAVVILWRRRTYWRKDEGQLLSFGNADAESGDIPIGYDQNKKGENYGGTR